MTKKNSNTPTRKNKLLLFWSSLVLLVLVFLYANLISKGGHRIEENGNKIVVDTSYKEDNDNNKFDLNRIIVDPVQQDSSGNMLKQVMSQMTVRSIKMRWATGGVNYSYLISTIDSKGIKHSMLIDPAEPHDVMKELSNEDLKHLEIVANTHHHYDHADGNLEMLKKIAQTNMHNKVTLIVGSKTQNSEITKESGDVVVQVAKDGDNIALGDSINIKFVRTPCHTQDSVCYHITNKNDFEANSAIFTGDTLFTAGCGRFFEGTGAEMDTALNKKLLSVVPQYDLLKKVKVFPGHEYTKSNVKFVRSKVYTKHGVNKALDALEKYVNENECSSGVFSLKDETEFNPFMRLDDPLVRVAVGDSNHTWERSKVMDKLREMKNSM